MAKRDIKLKLANRIGQKQDKSTRYRAVECASDGSRTTGSVWANEDYKLVYFQFFGSGGVGVARCQKLEPELGLGVYVGKTDDNLEWQVLEDDAFLRRTATDPRGYQSVAARDFEPGGRLQLWLYTKLIVPLATYDTPGTLEVNIVAGDYPYLGTRKTFAGQVGYDLTSHVPGGGLTRYIGLYLDSSNTLQAVDGATIAIGSTPAEPTWPAGAFRLSVVQLDNAQTSLSFADDIFDRRMPWSDVDSFAGWPFAHVLTVSSTDPDANYSNLPDAITNAVSGDTIELDSETYTLAAIISGINKSLKIRGQGYDKTIITCSEAGYVLGFAGVGLNIAFEGVKIEHAGATTGGAVEIGAGVSTLQIDNSILLSDALGAIDNTGLKLSSNASLVAKFRGSRIQAFNGTGTCLGLYITTNCFVDIDDACLLGGTTKVIYTTANFNATIVLALCRVEGLSPVFDINAGDKLRGRYINSSENIITITDTGESSSVWLDDESVGVRIKKATIATAITAAATGDVVDIGPDTYSDGITLDESITLRGKSPRETILTRSDNTSVTVDVTAANATLRNLTVAQTGAGVSVNCVATSANALVIDGCIIDKVSGAPTNSVGVALNDGDNHRITNTQITVSTGTNKYGVATGGVGSTSVVIESDVTINAATADIYIANAGDVVTLKGCRLLGGGINNAGGGTIRGWYVDAYGRTVRIKPIGIHNVRLTLESGVPCSVTDQTAKTEIFATPYEGNTVEVFNGIGWVEVPFAELSLSLAGFTADKNSDFFVYDNAGTLAVERTEWTNDTTRATALTVQDGRRVKSGALTRLYVGTFRTTGTAGQCEDSAANRFVWNYYNRKNRGLRRYRSNSHTYDTATFRAWDNDPTNTQARFVIGVVEDFIDVRVEGFCTMVAGGSTPYIGIGVNSTSVSSFAIAMSIPGALWFGGNRTDLTPAAGYNYLQPLEYGTATGDDPTFWEVQIQTTLRG